MNLGTGREEFIRLSGRFDLVNGDGSDNGADYWLNQGQNFLDDRVGHIAQAVNMTTLSANSFYVKVKWLKYPTAVYLIDPDSQDRYFLTRLDERTFKEGFSHHDQQTAALPLAYCMASNTLAPGLNYLQATVDTYEDGDQISLSLASLYKTLLIAPKADKAYECYVQGVYKSMELVEDTDSTHWTTRYSRLWLFASLYELEVGYKNQEAMKSWLMAIEDELLNLSKNQVELEIGDYEPVIEG